MATIASRVTTLETEMRTLKTRVTTLESHVTSLLSRVSAIEADLEPTPMPDPDPLPEPDPEPEPTPTPTPTGWPDATNTGAKGTLTNSGSISTNANGQVIENKKITGYVELRHPGCIIRNCHVFGNVGMFADDCVIEDCTVVLDGWNSAIRIENGADRVMVRRNNVSNFENGVVITSGTNHLIKDNYFHDPIDYRAPNSPHIDGVQFHGGTGHFSTVEHNNFDLYPEVSSCITMGNQTAGQGAKGNIVKDNRMIGGTSNLYIEGSDSSGVQVIGNHMARSVFGNYVLGTGMGTAFYSGNVNADTGQPIL